MVDHKEVKLCLLYTLLIGSVGCMSAGRLPFILKMGFIFSGIHLIENLGSGEPEPLRDGKLQ